MASKTFTVGEEVNKSGEKSICGKICKFASVLIAVAIAIVIGIYAFKKSFLGDFTGCNSPPILDQNGLSNWTLDAKVVAFGCFPGYFIEEGQSDILTSKCIKNAWKPPPPACNFLPMRLNCKVNGSGLQGTISMWQKTNQDPTHISGLVDYGAAIKSEGHLLESIFISRNNCTVSRDVENTSITSATTSRTTRTAAVTTTSSSHLTNRTVTEIPTSTIATPTESSHVLKVDFVSFDLKAYKKAEIHINMVFLNVNTSATIISVRQGSVTLVMPSASPVAATKFSSNEWNME